MTKQEIKEKIGGKLIGKEVMKRSIIEAVHKLPDEIIKKVVKDIWFVSNFEDAWGFVLKADELKGKSLIFLNDELFREGEKQISYTVLHEIGHVILNHRNAILKPQPESETKQQEREADKFAKEYL